MPRIYQGIHTKEEVVMRTKEIFAGALAFLLVLSGIACGSHVKQQFTMSVDSAHKHSWNPVYRTVVVQEAYDEVEYETRDIWTIHTFCNCHNQDISGLEASYPSTKYTFAEWLNLNGHSGGCHADYVAIDTKQVPAGITHHNSVTEQVFDHYECSCGSTKTDAP